MSSRVLPGAGFTCETVRYRVFLPSSMRDSRPLVLVHGKGRGAGRMFRSFLPTARLAGVPLLAPRFPQSTHADYQVLGGERGPWTAADDFDAVLADAARQHGLATETVDLLGFSGGAQFVHRYALVNPRRVRRLIVVSAGWYTYLDADRPFPQGLSVPSGSRHTPDPAGFLRIPTLVAVGEKDTESSGDLRHSRWLDTVQGRDRLTRALRWMDHLETEARSRGVSQQLEFALLPNTAHCQREAVEKGGLADLAAAHLAEKDHF